MNSIERACTSPQEVVLISLSDPQKAQEIRRVRMKPVLLKGTLHFQVESFTKKQSFTKNIAVVDLEKELQALTGQFSQVSIRFTDSKDHLRSLSHNKIKKYPLPDEEPVDFLIALGIQNKEGRVYREKYDKFRQINRFIELILPLLEGIQGPLRIVDLACGKAYLTFGLYYYLTIKLGHVVELYGVDVKKEVLDTCQALATRLGYTGLHFVVGTISDFDPGKTVDLVIALHACDTATDDAIQKALFLHAKAIAVAPCCQHSLLPQLRKEQFPLLFKHGLLKERFSALVTDALRASLLEEQGYKTDIVEFVDPEHTPKNLLIRARRKI